MADQLHWLQWQMCMATFMLQWCCNYVSKKCRMQATSFLFQSCCLFPAIVTHTLTNGEIYVIPHNGVPLLNFYQSNGLFRRSFYTFFFLFWSNFSQSLSNQFVLTGHFNTLTFSYIYSLSTLRPRMKLWKKDEWWPAPNYVIRLYACYYLCISI